MRSAVLGLALLLCACVEDPADDSPPWADVPVRPMRDASVSADSGDARPARPDGAPPPAPGDAEPALTDASPRVDAAPDVPTACEPERCNGRDDDCDGAVDEGLGVGEPCAAGEGTCRAEGRLACAADETVACDARPATPASEICNGADDDCDGHIDEDLGARACTAGMGACAAMGAERCQGGQTTCDAVPAAPGAEACNGRDDDCDGAIDEGLPGCATLTGSWRWTVTQADGRRFTSLVALVDAGGRVTGRAMDDYGLAAIEGRLVAADRSFELTKTYLAGASEDAVFRYTGTLGADALDGRYLQQGAAGAQPGALAATRAVDGLDPATLRGDWRLRADFADGDIHFEVTAEGHVTGTMADRVGPSTLDGVLDLGAGDLWFRKLYANGNDFWYRARAGGPTIEGGIYRDDSNSADRGVWRAER